MNLQTKINLFLVIVFCIGVCVGGIAGFHVIKHKMFSPMDAAGRYYHQYQLIQIYPAVAGNFYAYEAFEHEMGHHIWDKFLDRDERLKYIEIYRNATEYVSEYAMPHCNYSCDTWRRNWYDDVIEDFAENNRAAIGQCLQNYTFIPKDRRDFFANNVAKYIPFDMEVET